MPTYDNNNNFVKGLERIQTALTQEPWLVDQSFTFGHLSILNDWSGEKPPITLDQLKKTRAELLPVLSDDQKRVVAFMGSANNYRTDRLPTYQDLVDNINFKSKRAFLDYLILAIVLAFFISSFTAAGLLLDRVIPQHEHVIEHFDEERRGYLHSGSTRTLSANLWIASGAFFLLPLLAVWHYRRHALDSDSLVSFLTIVASALFIAALGISVDKTIKANKKRGKADRD